MQCHKNMVVTEIIKQLVEKSRENIGFCFQKAITLLTGIKLNKKKHLYITHGI